VKAAIKDRAISLGYQWLEERESRKLRRLIARMKYDDTNPVRRVKPIQIEHLRKWCPESEQEDVNGLQIALMLYLGHDGLLRIGELLSGIRAEDIRWSSDRKRFDIWLERSKANQSGDGELITVVDYDGCCAVKLMRKWFRSMDLWKLTDRMLFPSRRGKGVICWDKTISQSWFRKTIKTLADKAGCDGSKYSGHSLRAGGATDLFVARVPYFLIKKMGRWKSDAAMLYYR
jgi:hypothetical protein